MEPSQKTIKEYQDQYSNFDFQWLKGEEMSTIEKYKGISSNGQMIFIDFQSGRKINIDLLDEFMLTLPAAVQPVPHVNHQIQHQERESSVTSIVYEDSENPKNDSPIYKLLKKQKKNMVEVSIKIKLNLPPKELYNVLLGSFEEAEKEIIEFVLDGVDMNNIKKSLADSVKKSYYSDSQKSSKFKTEPEKEKTELED